jgi:hypothetical protein
MLTKAILQKMDEDHLCQDVLIPLFKEMGFNDVTFYHGGIGEQGKDVVFWKLDELNARVNYAVVVKSKPITGQAKSGKGTAGEVATQIQQSFGSTYYDPVTSVPQEVHVCWVVTNQKILKEGEESIRSIIKPSNYERHLKFINGDTLWELVQKYLGIQAVMGRLEEIQKTFNGFDTHYYPEIQLSEKTYR